MERTKESRVLNKATKELTDVLEKSWSSKSPEEQMRKLQDLREVHVFLEEDARQILEA